MTAGCTENATAWYWELIGVIDLRATKGNIAGFAGVAAVPFVCSGVIEKTLGARGEKATVVVVISDTLSMESPSASVEKRWSCWWPSWRAVGGEGEEGVHGGSGRRGLINTKVKESTHVPDDITDTIWAAR